MKWRTSFIIAMLFAVLSHLHEGWLSIAMEFCTVFWMVKALGEFFDTKDEKE